MSNPLTLGSGTLHLRVTNISVALNLTDNAGRQIQLAADHDLHGGRLCLDHDGRTTPIDADGSPVRIMSSGTEQRVGALITKSRDRRLRECILATVEPLVGKQVELRWEPRIS